MVQAGPVDCSWPSPHLNLDIISLCDLHIYAKDVQWSVSRGWAVDDDQPGFTGKINQGKYRYQLTFQYDAYANLCSASSMKLCTYSMRLSSRQSRQMPLASRHLQKELVSGGLFTPH